MDKNQVFIKTASGEEAVKQRTRLVQRNLRNVLIMVDGYSTVGELSERFGNANVVLAALQELEQSGFIETFERRIVREMHAGDTARAVVPHAEEASAEPAGEPPLKAAAEAEISSEDTDAKAQTVVADGIEGRPKAKPEEAPAAPAPSPSHPNLEPDEEIDLLSIGPLTLPPRLAEAQAAPQVAARASIAERLRGWFPAWTTRRAEKNGKPTPGRPEKNRVSIRPVSIGGRKAGRARLVGAVVALVVILPLAALAGLLVFPFDSYRAELEQQLGRAVGTKVRIGQLRFVLSPQPGLRADDIAIGAPPFAAIGVARILPDVLSLVSESKVIRELRLEQLDLREGAIERLALLGGGTGARGSDAPVVIQRIRLTGASIALGRSRLDGVNGDIELASSGTVEKILLRDAGSALKLEVTPKGGNYAAALSASNWKMPFPPNLTVDSLEATGELSATGLRFSRIEGRLYGGLLSGKGSVDWGSGAGVAGDLDLQRLDLAKLLPALNPDLGGGGDVSIKTRIEAKAESFGKLPEALRLTASYSVHRGQINRFDLAEAVRNPGRTPTRGGATKFEQLSGDLTLAQKSYRLNNLRVSSGLMRAVGRLDIGKNKQLDGLMTVEIKGTASLVRTPVTIGGSLAEPQLAATRGVRAGAASKGSAAER